MKISIIIPTIGRETLSEVLAGIKACTDYKAINPEILVVFDGQVKSLGRLSSSSLTRGSSNQSPLDSRIKSENDKNIKILQTKQKVYAGGARNLAMDKAQGDVFVFISDDTIPTKNWLSKIYKFHVLHPQKEKALLGKISWIPRLAKDPFHKWLEDYGQFQFARIEGLKNQESRIKYPISHAPYRYFYTSNVSVKRSLVADERFDLDFKGWGFEDGEFGYRLQQKGMKLHYDPRCEVLHDHELSLEDLKHNTNNAKKNAILFEKLHPEVLLRPKGLRYCMLYIACCLLSLLAPFNKKIRWWIEWKKSWI